MPEMPMAGRRKNVLVTDLDQPDNVSFSEAAATTQRQAPAKAHRQQRHGEKLLHTISGNFNRRSHSAEVNLDSREARGKEKAAKLQKPQCHCNSLLQAKDRQMQQLIQRLSTLHKFNEQFAEENQKLRLDVDTLEERQQLLQRQLLDDCGNCQKLAAQLTRATEQTSEHRADLDMMQTLVYRLNVQIEHYQDKLRHAAETTPSSNDAKLPQSARQDNGSALQRHTLAPLLQSYDEMLKEKQQLIDQYSEEFDHFTGELKRVLEENGRLLQSNEQQKRDVGNWREERTRLQAQLDVCRSKAEAQARKADLAKEKLVEVMHCYEQKMQTLMLDIDHLQSAYARCKTELAAMKSAAAQPPELIANSLQECRLLLDQLKEQHTRERQSLERTISELTQRSGNLQQLEQQHSNLQAAQQKTQLINEELQRRLAAMQQAVEKIKRSRDRLKARLRIALDWAKKLEEGQASMQGTWDALKRLETIVKHKESQVRGLHTRHMHEIEKMQRRLVQKEETIRSILKGKLSTAVTASGAAPVSAAGSR